MAENSFRSIPEFRIPIADGDKRSRGIAGNPASQAKEEAAAARAPHRRPQSQANARSALWFPVRKSGENSGAGILLRFSFGTACSSIINVNAVTRRCLDRSSDSSSIFRSFVRLISAIATSKARWRKLAQSDKGASWMIFPSASLTDANPSTFRRSSNEMRLIWHM
jgi:hypothetical protein